VPAHAQFVDRIPRRRRTRRPSTSRPRRTASSPRSSCALFPACTRQRADGRAQKADGSKAVSVGSTIAILAEEGDDLSKASALASESSSDAAPKKDSSEGSKPAPAEDQKGADKPAPAADGKAQTLTESAPPPAQSSAPPPKSAPRAGDRIYASPIAKAIALERGVPLGKVKGTGPGGRIVREDVEKYQPEAASAAPAKSAAPASAGAAAAEYTDTPVSSMRRTIGARLLQSKQEIPHYYVTADVNMDKVLKLRQVFNADLAKKDGGAKLSVNDFVVKAVACALADVPEANSAWLGETIRT
jgi:pyruvate dehydrogenase E2 component (dihydrolipoamide acetyltransferase)